MKMLFLFSVLLMLKLGFCTEDDKLMTKTVDVGQTVTLMCPFERSLYQEALFWIRLVSGNQPEFLGAAFDFESVGVSKVPHINISLQDGMFILHINGVQLNETGLYYCVKVKQLKMTFINGTFLKIKGPESGITAVIQEVPSDPVRPGDPVTLQCSVLSDTEKKSCSADHRVYWFRSGSDESHPKLIYTHGNSRGECEKSPETESEQKCFYDFSKNISPSDAGTYYCAVATCGEILFGPGAAVKIEGPKTVLILLCAALSASLLFISCLINAIRKKTCGCCYDAATDRSEQRLELRDERTLVYSAPTFTKKKAEKAERRNKKTAQEETVYTDVKTLHKKHTV